MIPSSDSPRIVLASASPRRQALLKAGGVRFEVRVSALDESPYHHPSAPRASALKTAMAKASAVAPNLPRDTIVIGADTLVVLEDGAYTKPANRDEARRMLARLSGRRHEVITGLALHRVGGETLVDADVAGVHFRQLDPAAIDRYLASGEADDKAGAYGIQGEGADFITEVEGDLTCVIGLPLLRLEALFLQMTGLALFNGRRPLGIARMAFPDLDRLPPACFQGLRQA